MKQHIKIYKMSTKLSGAYLITSDKYLFAIQEGIYQM